MIALDYTTATVDAAAAACGPVQLHSAWERERPSISGTAGCRGCTDPQCGYCEVLEERSREDRIDAEHDKIVRSERDMNTLLDNLFVEGYGHRIAEMLRLHIERDDRGAGDIARDLLISRINELAERRAA